MIMAAIKWYSDGIKSSSPGADPEFFKRGLMAMVMYKLRTYIVYILQLKNEMYCEL